jgi:TPR repeat protein
MSLSFRRSVALLVGIGNYKYLMPQLEYVSKDVEKMRDYLLREGDFDAVYVMNERTTPQMLDSYMLDKFRGILSSEDRLLFYYSGHGSDPGGGHAFLQFQGARPGEWSHDVLRVDQFQVWSDVIPAKHVVFIFDACLAGEAIGKAPYNETGASIAELSANGSRTVVTAGTAEQKAWMLKLSSDNTYSIFTEGLLRALRGGAADPKDRGFLTIEQAVAEAQVQMADMTRKLGPGHEMKPEPVAIRPNYKGTFVFLNPHAQKPPLPQGDATYLGVAVTKGTDPGLEKELELVFWKSVEPLKDPDLYELVCRRFPAGTFCPVSRKLIEQMKASLSPPTDIEKASLEELKHYAESGLPSAIIQLGKAYESGLRGAPQDVQAAIGYYMRASSLGDGAAAFRLGEIYRWGRKGVPVDLGMAVRWYESGMTQGNSQAIASLGVMYDRGQGGLARDQRRARELYQKSADLGDPLGMAYLGVSYENGQGELVKDERRAVRLYQESADLGNSRGMAYLGAAYENGQGGLAKDEHKAVELYQKSADLGDFRGMAYLGIEYANGKGGLAKDDRKAVELFQRAADLGDPISMCYLGVAYEFGEGGLAKDERKGVELYQKAADLGETLGMAYVGVAYERGQGGLAKDERKGVELFQRAADLGGSLGVVYLGIAYERGKGGLAKDERRAVELYQKAAGLGDSLGMVFLGLAYEYGKGGLAKDERRAAELYETSAAQGNEYAAQQLARLRGRN